MGKYEKSSLYDIHTIHSSKRIPEIWFLVTITAFILFTVILMEFQPESKRQPPPPSHTNASAGTTRSYDEWDNMGRT